LNVVAVKVVGEAERTIGFEPVWKGKKPNWTEINRFEPVFGSVRFKKLKKKIRFGCLFWFKTGPNRKCSALVCKLIMYHQIVQFRVKLFTIYNK
jgi:hypothetical protein